MYLSQVAVLMLAVATSADHYHPDRQETTKDKKIQHSYSYNTGERNPAYWKDEAIEGINKRLNDLLNENIARNVILFVGDGMSIPTLTAARILKGQRQNRTGEETQMFFETFPTTGLSKTYCLDEQIPESACTATAYLTGVKNNYGTTGVTGDVPRGDCLASVNPKNRLNSIAVWAIADGRDAGIVTTARVTHATPAATYARVASRNWESNNEVEKDGFNTNICPDIALQLVHTFPGNEFKVILGGGRRSFFPNTRRDEEGTKGRRTDKRNLIQEWQNDKKNRNVSYQYVWNRSQLINFRTSPPDYLLGLFEGSHMQFHLEADTVTEPTLAELTEVAINSLSRNEKGYFLFVEGGLIDHGQHENWPHLALDETIEFDLAIKKAVEMVGEDTLIVVTADHAHVMSINGYSKRGNNILGISNVLGKDKIPYMTLSYINGPGARKQVNNSRQNVTQDKHFMTLRWRSHAEVMMSTETHGGEDVPVFAWGPQHHMLSGSYEQSQIPWRMAYAACMGPGLQAEACMGRSSASQIFYHIYNMLYYLCLIKLLWFFYN